MEHYMQTAGPCPERDIFAFNQNTTVYILYTLHIIQSILHIQQTIYNFNSELFAFLSFDISLKSLLWGLLQAKRLPLDIWVKMKRK